jgi:hypothetical protein
MRVRLVAEVADQVCRPVPEQVPATLLAMLKDGHGSVGCDSLSGFHG